MNQQKKGLSSPIQTRVAGVVANITRFEKSEEFIEMELTLQNTSSRTAYVCAEVRSTNLIDQTTGESWKPHHYAGQDCQRLNVNQSGRVWMKFEIPDPEKRIFSLSSRLFTGPVDRLALGESF